MRRYQSIDWPARWLMAFILTTPLIAQGIVQSALPQTPAYYQAFIGAAYGYGSTPAAACAALFYRWGSSYFVNEGNVIAYPNLSYQCGFRSSVTGLYDSNAIAEILTAPVCPIPASGPAYAWNYRNGMCERDVPCQPPSAEVNGQCVNETYSVTLTGGSTTEPSTILPFSAVVKDQNGVVKPGIQVTIKANVQDGTGGHKHTDSRPKGNFTCSSALSSSPASCTLTTDASGQIQFDFVATPISGKHTITATCDGCSNTEMKNVDVMVSGLIPIPEAPLLYALKDSKGVVGAIPGKHTANHYLTSKAIGKLEALAKLYKTKISPQGVLYLNDASLEWGGLFDVGKDTPWASPHSTHDRGLSLDIRAENSGPNNEGAVLAADFIKFDRQAKRAGFNMGLHCNGSTVTRVCLNIPYNRHIHVDF